MTVFWMIGGAVALLGALIHGVAGHRLFVVPLLASDALNEVQKALASVCWHAVTIAFLSYAGALWYAALVPEASVLVWMVVLTNIAVALLFLFLGVFGHSVLRRLPGAWLALAIAGFGLAGLYIS